MPFIFPCIIRGAVICPAKSVSRCPSLSLLPGPFTSLPGIMFFGNRKIIFCLVGWLVNWINFQHTETLIWTTFVENNTNHWQMNVRLIPRLIWWKHGNINSFVICMWYCVYNANVHNIRATTGHLPGKVGTFGGTPFWPFTFFIRARQHRCLRLLASHIKQQKAKSPSSISMHRMTLDTKSDVVGGTGNKTRQNVIFTIIPWCLQKHCLANKSHTWNLLKSLWLDCYCSD